MHRPIGTHFPNGEKYKFSFMLDDHNIEESLASETHASMAVVSSLFGQIDSTTDGRMLCTRC